MTRSQGPQRPPARGSTCGCQLARQRQLRPATCPPPHAAPAPSSRSPTPLRRAPIRPTPTPAAPLICGRPKARHDKPPPPAPIARTFGRHAGHMEHVPPHVRPSDHQPQKGDIQCSRGDRPGPNPRIDFLLKERSASLPFLEQNRKPTPGSPHRRISPQPA